MEVGNKSDSDFHPIIVWVRGKEDGKTREGGRKISGRGRGKWNKDERAEFLKLVGKKPEGNERGIEEE